MAGSAGGRPVLGLTGMMASGKNLAAEVFRCEWGWAVIDLDRLGHRALARLEAPLRAAFGDGILKPSAVGGGIDRGVLGRLVFSDPAALARLESIVHPEMVRQVREILAEDRSPACVLNAAILHRMGLDTLCHHVLYISVPVDSLVRRIMERNGISPEAALERLAGQEDVNRSGKTADTVLENDASPEDFLDRVRAFAQNWFGSIDNGDATIAVRRANGAQEGPLYPQS